MMMKLTGSLSPSTVQFLVRLFRQYDAGGTGEVDKDKLVKAG